MVALLPWIPVKLYKCLINKVYYFPDFLVLCHPRYATVAVLAFRRVRDVLETLEIPVKFTIPAIPPMLTSSRGEYLRVVGIHSDG